MIRPVNMFKRRLAEQGVQIGLWQALGSAYTAEICATSGFDWLLFDGEHGLNHMPGLLAQLQAVAGSGVSSIARVPSGETWIIKQYLDVGFQTLLVPFVESAAQARALVQAMRYGPDGVRGVASGITRAGRWGRVPEYLDKAHEDLCLLVQIETVAGFERIEEIAAVDGVDAVFVGPADLSAAFGHRGRPGDSEMARRIADAFARIAASGKPAGTLAVTPEAFRDAAASGCRFIAAGTDVGLLTRGADALLASVRAGAEASATAPAAY